MSNILQMLKHKSDSAIVAFLAQVNSPGDWDVITIRYATIVNFTQMILNDKVNNLNISN